jgi:hypothetical protein
MAKLWGQGRVFRRGRRWWIAFYHQGKEIREPSHSTNEKVAQNLLKDRLGAVYAGAFVGPQQGRVLVAELLETLRVEMEARELRAGTPSRESSLGSAPRLAGIGRLR